MLQCSELLFILSNQALATRQGGELRGIWSSHALFSASKEQRRTECSEVLYVLYSSFLGFIGFARGTYDSSL